MSINRSLLRQEYLFVFKELLKEYDLKTYLNIIVFLLDLYHEF